MKCPHCTVAVAEAFTQIPLELKDKEGHNEIRLMTCPECNNFIVYLDAVWYDPNVLNYAIDEDTLEVPDPSIVTATQLIYPKSITRKPCPPEVPDDIASDYRQACRVLDVSPQASAALSRRCLEHIISQHFGEDVKHLGTAIGKFIKLDQLSSLTSTYLDSIKTIGNFSVHVKKSTHTGEILEVEEGEAEWCLEVLELMFDDLYVRPERVRKIKERLGIKDDENKKPTEQK